MKPTLTISVSRVKNIFFTENSYVFLVCLLLAISFWFLNAFTKNYSTLITYNVRYVGLPKNKVAINKLPSNFVVKVRGGGFQLVLNQLSKNTDSIVVDASDIHYLKKGKEDIGYISSVQIKNNIASSFSEGVELQQLLIDTLYFKFEPKITKWVRVKSNLDISFERQFTYAGKIENNPPKVIISGPKSIVDTIQQIYTEKKVLKNINTTTSVDLVLNNNSAFLKIIPNKIQTKIPVEQFTEAIKTITIQTKNVPDSLSLRLFPATIDVHYLVGLSHLEVSEGKNIIAFVDYKEMPKNGINKLKIHLDNVPSYLEIVSASQEKIEFIQKLK